MHAGQVRGYGDDIHGHVVRHLVRAAHCHLPSLPAGISDDLPAQSCRALRSSSSRGSGPDVAIRRSSSADLALLFSSCGTVTSTVASSAPRVPSLRRTPRPATRNTRPLGVPGGILTVTAA